MRTPLPIHRGQGNRPFATDEAGSVVSRGQTSPYEVNGAPTGATVADGDYGDVIVSGSGTAWDFDPTVVTAFARTILDDPDAATVRSTIGAAAASHTHVVSDVTGLQAALDAKLDDSQAGAFGLSFLGSSTITDARTTLGLGTASQQNIGTSGPNVALLSGNNEWSGTATFNGLFRPKTWSFVGAAVDTTLNPTDHAGRLVDNTGGGARTWTISPEASNAWATQTFMFLSVSGAGSVTLARGAGVSLTWMGVDANRTLASGAFAFLRRVTTDSWRIVGIGVS